MREAILQNQMDLDILTSAQGGICALIKTTCCVYIPDNSVNASEVLKDLPTQIDAMSDPKKSFGDLLSS
jgi:hypothetical protein